MNSNFAMSSRIYGQLEGDLNAISKNLLYIPSPKEAHQNKLTERHSMTYDQLIENRFNRNLQDAPRLGKFLVPLIKSNKDIEHVLREMMSKFGEDIRVLLEALTFHLQAKTAGSATRTFNNTINCVFFSEDAKVNYCIVGNSGTCRWEECTSPSILASYIRDHQEQITPRIINVFAKAVNELIRAAEEADDAFVSSAAKVIYYVSIDHIENLPEKNGKRIIFARPEYRL